MQRAVADHAADAVVDVDAGREGQVDAADAQFRRHQPAELAREREPFRTLHGKSTADVAQRRQARETLAETLHPPALLVHGDEERRRADRVDLRREARELLGALVVAREEDDAAHLRVREQVALLRLDRDAREVHHHRPERHRLRLE